ncbi:DEAD-box ATP-dependent RNA helicase 45-like [Lycium barbarum]|uniref:DEAD-box ATP-dependent RNA helicase 45-like n=1 Tax=Lycium barbarum TaxID=112863 RepID=UPI00293E8AD9|nr:DEAD-box ATP-dependent RNA helicase 45-like [Lycium barbarum]
MEDSTFRHMNEQSMKLKAEKLSLRKAFSTANEIDEEVSAYWKKLGFSLYGKNIPSPIKEWNEAGLHRIGSSMTLAYVLPMLRQVDQEPLLRYKECPIGIIIILLHVLFLILKSASRDDVIGDLGFVSMYGRNDFANQIYELSKEAHIVLCTPACMNRKLYLNGEKLMNQADMMFDKGFEPRLREIIIVRVKSTVNSDIKQTIEVIEIAERFSRLRQLIGECKPKGKMLIFAKTNLLVSTTVLARGIDLKNVISIINYEEYVNRIGRTGRAETIGFAITVISEEEEKFAPYLLGSLNHAKEVVLDRLEELALGFNARVKRGEVQAYDSGYGGKSFEVGEDF